MLGLGRLLLGLAAAAATAVAVAVVVHRIRGMITRQTLSAEARKNGMNCAVVDAINHCKNTVKLTDINGKEETFEGDSIASEVQVGLMV